MMGLRVECVQGCGPARCGARHDRLRGRLAPLLLPDMLLLVLVFVLLRMMPEEICERRMRFLPLVIPMVMLHEPDEMRRMRAMILLLLLLLLFRLVRCGGRAPRHEIPKAATPSLHRGCSGPSRSRGRGRRRPRRIVEMRVHCLSGDRVLVDGVLVLVVVMMPDMVVQESP